MHGARSLFSRSRSNSGLLAAISPSMILLADLLANCPGLGGTEPHERTYSHRQFADFRAVNDWADKNKGEGGGFKTDPLNHSATLPKSKDPIT